MEQVKRIYLSIPEEIGKPYGMQELLKLQDNCENLGFKVYNPVILLNEFKKLIQYELTEYQKFSYTMKYLSMSNIFIRFSEWQDCFRCKTEYRIAQKTGMLLLQFDIGGTVPIQSLHKNLLNELSDWLKRN